MGLRSNGSFLRLFVGRIVTNAGDSIYAIAAMWLVFELTNSSFYTGVAGFLTFGAQALQFLVGPLVDRWSLRNVLVGSQLVQLFGVLVVPLAATTGHLTVWLILVLMPLLELVNQFVYPAQNAALPRIVKDDQLVRANSLFSFAYKGMDMVFNAASGILIALVGAVTLYVLDAVTFAIAFVLFFGLTIPESSPNEDELNDDEVTYFDKLREGFDYVRGSAVVDLVLGTALANFASGLLIAALPAFAASIGGPTAYGLLYGVMSAGALVGSAVASFVDEWGYGRVMILGQLLSGLCWIGALLVHGLPAVAALLFAAVIPTSVTNVLSGSMLQSAIDNELLGRVTSLSSSVGMFTIPLGSIFGGVIADVTGPKFALVGMAVAAFSLSVYYTVRPRLRSLPSVKEADEVSLGLKPLSGTDAIGPQPETAID